MTATGLLDRPPEAVDTRVVELATTPPHAARPRTHRRPADGTGRGRTAPGPRALSRTGIAAGAVVGLVSFSPSLLPREWWVQGLLTGVSSTSLPPSTPDARASRAGASERRHDLVAHLLAQDLAEHRLRQGGHGHHTLGHLVGGQ